MIGIVKELGEASVKGTTGTRGNAHIIGLWQSELKGLSAEIPFVRTPCHSNAGKI